MLARNDDHLDLCSPLFQLIGEGAHVSHSHDLVIS
jgi:hypothetical protein